jgi:hypothetical protein
VVIGAAAILARGRRTGAEPVVIAAAAAVGAAILQLAPLPSSIVAAIDPPACDYVRATRLGAPAVACAATRLTVDPLVTSAGIAIGAGTVLLFRAAIDVFAVTGIRRTVSTVLVVGIGVGIAAAMHQAIYGGRAYWWRPLAPGAPRIETFGPFVNRNHFATWLIMAAPLATGFLLTRATMQPPSRSWRDVVRKLDSGLLTLAAGCALLVVLLMLTASRSGLTGLGVATALAWLPARRRAERRTRWTAIGALALAAVLAMFAGNLSMIVQQIESTVRDGAGGRVAIWRDTMRVIAAFWPWGSGIGTFGEVMTLYQTADPSLHFNQAHNHYLQLAAEGGVLVCAPMAAALVLLARLTARRLAEDHSGLWWTRLGAAAGLAAVAFQSVWETGLRMPANAALFAVVAAIAVHPPRAGEIRTVACR